MILTKETSERSDRDNWVKNILLSQSGYYLESIEGCNQNAENQVTHLIERAFCPAFSIQYDLKTVYNAILHLEGAEAMKQKIAFCQSFNIPLSYLIYGNKPLEFANLFTISEAGNIILDLEFTSYQAFSAWIKSIKGWRSSSSFQHKEELPFFDKELRRYGTAWPTNIDCFISSLNNQPTAILEFQNAHKTPLATHCNNNYFWGLTGKDDIRRWFSQEILRIQSGLPFIVITWSKIHKGFIVKKLDKVVFPNFTNTHLKNLLSQFVRKRVNGTGQKTARQLYDEICNTCESEELVLMDGVVQIKVNKPPLSFENKTFPMLYYSFKHKELEDNGKLIEIFKSII
jgi:hypothetical protein